MTNNRLALALAVALLSCSYTGRIQAAMLPVPQQTQQLFPTLRGDFTHFGGDVAIQGTTAAIWGNGGADVGYAGAHIFELGADKRWHQIMKAVPSPPFPAAGAFNVIGDVDVSGDKLLYSFPGGAFQQGRAFIFERNPGDNTSWHHSAIMLPSIDATNWGFGQAAALDGDTVIVGDPIEGSTYMGAPGAAYIFERNYGGANAWGETIRLTTPTSGYDFGFSVEVRGDTAVVGQINRNHGTGAVHIYDRNHGGVGKWGLLQSIIPPADSYRVFGSTLSLNGDTLAVGAANWALVYKRSGPADAPWQLRGGVTTINDFEFGESVELAGDSLYVTSGHSVYRIFLDPATNQWRDRVKFTANSEVFSLAVDGPYMFLGCPTFGTATLPPTDYFMLEGTAYVVAIPEPTTIIFSLLATTISLLARKQHRISADSPRLGRG